jgi:BlaI family penicillinase repressor
MNKKPEEKDLSRRERQLLDALYRLGKASAAELREEIPSPPTYTAVRTHLTNLEAKGFVRFASDGVRYIYEPLIAREQMAEEVMSGVLETFFDNRLELAVSALLRRKETEVSQEALDRLAAIIEQARKEGR